LKAFTLEEKVFEFGFKALILSSIAEIFVCFAVKSSRARVPSVSVPFPVVCRVMFPAASMLLPIFVVVSVMLLPPRFLLPQVVSVRFLSSKAWMLISSPAVMDKLPLTPPSPSRGEGVVVVISEAKLVKSFFALIAMLPPLMLDIPSKLEFMFPERLLALFAMVRDCIPLEM